jgi:TPR repeat protein
LKEIYYEKFCFPYGFQARFSVLLSAAVLAVCASAAFADAKSDYDQGQKAQTKEDYAKAAAFHEKACDLGETDSCVSIGLYYRTGYEIKQDEKKALALYKKACDKGNMEGCWSFGFMYEYSEGLEIDVKKANEFYKKSCDGGYAEGCSSVALAYEAGIGVKKDMKKAAEYYKNPAHWETNSLATKPPGWIKMKKPFDCQG